ncbi:10317_t:CDS:1, partial [Acaulospora morrowiae]
PRYVFQSPAWKRFFPLFLTIPQRQQDDLEFYNILQEIRTGCLSSKSINTIESKININNNSQELYNTTHIVNLRQAADIINEMLCSHLPFDDTQNDPIISIANDILDFEILDDNHTISQFKHQTNLPKSVHLQEGARVMFLNNKLFDDDICNGTIGIVTDIINNTSVEVTFPTFTSINKVIVQKETTYFEIDGKRASRQQFPLQNAFALTAHKVQGLTLPHITTSIDETVFIEGQVYVAMSRATSWKNLRILSFNYHYLKSPKAALEEYKRLNIIYNDGLRNM